MYGLAAAAVDVGAGAAYTIHQIDSDGGENRSAARRITHSDGKTADYHIVISVACLDSDIERSPHGVGPGHRDNSKVIDCAEGVHVEVPIHERAVVFKIVEIIRTAGGGVGYRECETGGTVHGGVVTV